MCGYLILFSIFYLLTYLPLIVYTFIVSNEKIYQTLKTLFDRLSTHLEARHKYSFTRPIINSLLGVRKCGQRRSFLFDRTNFNQCSLHACVVVITGFSLEIGWIPLD